MSASRKVHFSLRRQRPSRLNTDDTTLSDHAGVHWALGNDLLTLGGKDGKYVCSSLCVLADVLTVQPGFLVLTLALMKSVSGLGLSMVSQAWW